jgi:hypothetical protein
VHYSSVGLVKDFQSDLLQSKKTTVELLRIGKAISVKLGLDDITEWLNSELNGYADNAAVPPYRHFAGGELQIRNPVRGWMPGWQLKGQFPIRQPIAELEDLTKSKSIVTSLTHDQHYPVQGDLGRDLSDWPQQIEFSTVQLKGVLSAVAEKLLDWSLELEKRRILGEDMSFDESERQSAHNQTFHIQSFTGVLGNVSHSNVQIYDYSSLHQTLKQQNVPQDERNKLENIMDELKNAQPDKKSGLMQKAKAWIVRNQEFLGASATIVKKALGLDSV